MPQCWSFRVGLLDRAVSRAQLHAVLSSWLDVDENHSDPRKGWSLRNVLFEDSALYFEVGIVDDLLCRVLAGLRVGASIRFGSQNCQLLRSPELVFADSWSELATTGQSGELQNLVVRTPMVFRHRSVTVAPSAGLVLGHYRAVWTRFSALTLPEVLAEGLSLAGLVEADFEGTTVKVGQGEGWGRTNGSGFVGSVRLQSLSSDSDVRRAIGALVRLAPFCGTGSATPFGCGLTEVPLAS
jgi:hypothetical protein